MSNFPSDFNDAIIVLPLTNSPEICLINFSDYNKCIKHNWHLNSNGYPSTNIHKRPVRLHQLLGGKFTDHKDGIKLNNTRENFRHATNQQNQCNKKKQQGNWSSKYKGVCWDKRKNRWMVYIDFNSKRKFLGYSDNEIEAAKKYNKAAIELHKEHACLNEIC